MASIYIALNMTKSEIKAKKLTELVPARKSNRGRAPTIQSITDDQKIQLQKWKFLKPPSFYTPEEQKAIMEAVIETMILATFDRHIYRWGGKVYRQRKGEP